MVGVAQLYLPFALHHPGSGRPRYGMRGRPWEAAIVQQIYAEVAAQRAPVRPSLTGIALRLTAEGIPAPDGAGRPWGRRTLAYILANPAYDLLVGPELARRARRALERPGKAPPVSTRKKKRRRRKKRARRS